MPIAVVTHDICSEHNPGIGHPERPERRPVATQGIQIADLGEAVIFHEAPPADDAAIRRVHSDAMIQTTIDAAGGERIDGETDGVLCAVRPPGHHATPDHPMGFCVFNSAAIAARALGVGATLSALQDHQYRPEETTSGGPGHDEVSAIATQWAESDR